ncbi:MAG: RnfABCDGE type electron transport complex subunit G [Thiomicrorhabdus chilensis]|uniref:RnfABCDGE type electron transport complex subunit G n=1 Tax=Thiomicrorhabdus chilensis TaxID=63656 RepID=UPI00299E2005|nr:RnfABCDGE type electron transport complex subunit G [Thiomicrorhabdus chilensis]MDX1348584.1 RnfABCDGE type electron transport complex subunit G [Thiomicrorhabdus chilensis]
MSRQRSDETVLYSAGFLGFACAVSAALLLAIVNLTEPIIELRFREDQLVGLNQVLPVSELQNDLLSSEVTVLHLLQEYRMFTGMTENSDPLGYAVQFSVEGYAGPIVILMGVNADLSIRQVRVLSHSETPGLGDKIELGKTSWVNQFSGLQLDSITVENWAVKKDGGQFDQFSGATITPRAVVNGIHQTLVELPAIIREAETQRGRSATGSGGES